MQGSVDAEGLDLGGMEILAVDGGPQLEQVRELFEEFWTSFGFTPCFQSFGSELAGLPGEYTAPHGRLALARIDGAAAAARRCGSSMRNGAKPSGYTCGPQFRGRGLGLALLNWVIDEARRAGYHEMVGDYHAR